MGRKLSASGASKWLAELLSQKPDSNDRFSLGILIAGWDSELGAALFKLNGKGEFEESSMAGTGYGGGSCFGFDRNPSRFTSIDEAKDFAKNTLSFIANCVPESVGLVSVFNVGCRGVKQVVSDDSIADYLKERYRKSGREWKDERQLNSSMVRERKACRRAEEAAEARRKFPTAEEIRRVKEAEQVVLREWSTQKKH
ncbi:OLC1v1014958C2 [Oldenlandia corymbosa var. corymbosa]|nr:OLC1v1014958C2 [Oldenlandia corymbosa var. corymbosa]